MDENVTEKDESPVNNDSEKLERAKTLVNTVKKEMAAAAKGSLRIAAALYELEKDDLFKQILPEERSCELFARHFLSISHGSYYHYKKLQGFCKVEEGTGKLLPLLKEEFQDFKVTELYALKPDEDPAARKRDKKKRKQFKSVDELMEWLHETGVTPETFVVQFLDTWTGNGRQESVMATIDPEDRKVEVPSDQSAA